MRTAAIASSVLLVVFIVGVGSAWARGLQIDCGCFGNGGQVAAGQTAYPAEVARDVGLLIVALLLARWPRSRFALGAHHRAADREGAAPCPLTGKRAAAQRRIAEKRAAEALARAQRRAPPPGDRRGSGRGGARRHRASSS